MKFTYDPDTYTIWSEDPAIFVRVMGLQREAGLEFLLCMGKKKIGFRTADDYTQDKTHTLPDGTLVWSFDVVLCQIFRWDEVLRRAIECTNTYHFSDVLEQREVLSTFSDALTVYNGKRIASASGKAKARVEYTAQVLERAARGKFIQK